MQARDTTTHPTQRRDIQGLRAVAVLLVLVYHLRPNRLPGGFLGVDVFFVISGFLIIGGLFREAVGGSLDLARFYGKRIRRLLPAATVVLVSVTVATMLLSPAAAWPATMKEVVASALQVQNWQLAASSADYVQATASASPVQHFWSLAVEEQFYIVTPVLIVAVVLAFRRGPRLRTALTATIWAATLASFAFSVLYTPGNHTPAYFITPTRIWQLGIGGLLAIHPPRLSLRARQVLGWVSFAVVVACAFTYSTSMEFPGWVALAPTLASAGLVAAGPDDEHARFSHVSSLLARQPWHYVGDISYSLYLWHWPVIVFALSLSSSGYIATWAGPLVAALSIALAAASTRFVEEPFRRRRAPRRRTTFALGAALVTCSLVVSGPAWAHGQREMDAALAGSGLDVNHQGFHAVHGAIGPSRIDRGVDLRPVPAVALQDLSRSFKDHCDGYDLTKYPATSDHCLYGRKDAPKLAILVGDSHAGQYSTAIIEAIKRHPDWRLKVMNRNRCPFSAEPPIDAGAPWEVCRKHNADLLRAIEQLEPDLLVTTAMSPRSYRSDAKLTWPSEQALSQGYRRQLAGVRRTGADVVVLAELPRPAQPVPACLQRNLKDPTACDTPRAQALQPGDRPLADVARSVPGVRVVDPMPVVCGPAVCPAVIGNVVVFRDNHLSNTYVRSLTGWVESQLRLR